MRHVCIILFGSVLLIACTTTAAPPEATVTGRGGNDILIALDQASYVLAWSGSAATVRALATQGQIVVLAGPLRVAVLDTLPAFSADTPAPARIRLVTGDQAGLEGYIPAELIR